MTALMLILKTVFTFIATEVDDFIVFVILYSKNREKKNRLLIFIAQLVVLMLVTAASGFAASLLSKIPEKYIRFIGILPLAIGLVSVIKLILKKQDDDEDEKTPAKTDGLKSLALFISSASVVIASSGDNLGIYIPFFLNMSISWKIIVLAMFMILQCGWSVLQIKAAELPLMQKVIQKSGRILEPVVFIILGILILAGF